MMYFSHWNVICFWLVFILQECLGLYNSSHVSTNHTNTRTVQPGTAGDVSQEIHLNFTSNVSAAEIEMKVKNILKPILATHLNTSIRFIVKPPKNSNRSFVGEFMNSIKSTIDHLNPKVILGAKATSYKNKRGDLVTLKVLLHINYPIENVSRIYPHIFKENIDLLSSFGNGVQILKSSLEKLLKLSKEHENGNSTTIFLRFVLPSNDSKKLKGEFTLASHEVLQQIIPNIHYSIRVRIVKTENPAISKLEIEIQFENPKNKPTQLKEIDRIDSGSNKSEPNNSKNYEENRTLLSFQKKSYIPPKPEIKLLHTTRDNITNSNSEKRNGNNNEKFKTNEKTNGNRNNSKTFDERSETPRAIEFNMMLPSENETSSIGRNLCQNIRKMIGLFQKENNLHRNISLHLSLQSFSNDNEITHNISRISHHPSTQSSKKEEETTPFSIRATIDFPRDILGTTQHHKFLNSSSPSQITQKKQLNSPKYGRSMLENKESILWRRRQLPRRLGYPTSTDVSNQFLLKQSPILDAQEPHENETENTKNEEKENPKIISALKKKYSPKNVSYNEGKENNFRSSLPSSTKIFSSTTRSPFSINFQNVYGKINENMLGMSPSNNNISMPWEKVIHSKTVKPIERNVHTFRIVPNSIPKHPSNSASVTEGTPSEIEAIIGPPTITPNPKNSIATTPSQMPQRTNIIYSSNYRTGISNSRKPIRWSGPLSSSSMTASSYFNQSFLPFSATSSLFSTTTRSPFLFNFPKVDEILNEKFSPMYQINKDISLEEKTLMRKYKPNFRIASSSSPSVNAKITPSEMEASIGTSYATPQTRNSIENFSSQMTHRSKFYSPRNSKGILNKRRPVLWSRHKLPSKFKYLTSPESFTHSHQNSPSSLETETQIRKMKFIRPFSSSSSSSLPHFDQSSFATSITSTFSPSTVNTTSSSFSSSSRSSKMFSNSQNFNERINKTFNHILNKNRKDQFTAEEKEEKIMYWKKAKPIEMNGKTKIRFHSSEEIVETVNMKFAETIQNISQYLEELILIGMQPTQKKINHRFVFKIQLPTENFSLSMFQNITDIVSTTLKSEIPDIDIRTIMIIRLNSNGSVLSAEEVFTITPQFSYNIPSNKNTKTKWFKPDLLKFASGFNSKNKYQEDYSICRNRKDEIDDLVQYIEQKFNSTEHNFNRKVCWKSTKNETCLDYVLERAREELNFVFSDHNMIFVINTSSTDICFTIELEPSYKNNKIEIGPININHLTTEILENGLYNEISLREKEISKKMNSLISFAFLFESKEIDPFKIDELESCIQFVLNKMGMVGNLIRKPEIIFKHKRFYISIIFSTRILSDSKENSENYGFENINEKESHNITPLEFVSDIILGN